MSDDKSRTFLAPIPKVEDPSTRRDFIRMAAQSAVAGAAGTLLSGCGDGVDSVLAPPQPEVRANLLVAGGPHRISVSSPRSVLRRGSSVTIAATIQDAKGKPVANTVVGVADGLRFLSSFTKTDSRGRIAYRTVVGVSGAAVMELVVDGYRYPFIFQASSSRSPYNASSAAITGIAIRNRTNRTLRSKLRDSNGRAYVVDVAKNATKSVIAVKTALAQRVTVYGGVTLSTPAAQTSVTLDSRGVTTLTVTGGQAHLRASVYGTSQGEIGACWAPGGQMGVAIVQVSGEVAVCLGTDGLSIGASGAFGGATAGFEIEVI